MIFAGSFLFEELVFLLVVAWRKVIVSIGAICFTKAKTRENGPRKRDPNCFILHTSSPKCIDPEFTLYAIF